MKITVRLILRTQRGIIAQKHDGLWGFISITGQGVSEEDWKRIAIEGLEKLTGISSSPGHYVEMTALKSKKINKRNRPKRYTVLSKVGLSDATIIGELSPPLSQADKLSEFWFEDMPGIDFNTNDMLTLIEQDIYRHAA